LRYWGARIPRALAVGVSTEQGVGNGYVCVRRLREVRDVDALVRLMRLFELAGPEDEALHSLAASTRASAVASAAPAQQPANTTKAGSGLPVAARAPNPTAAPPRASAS